MTDPSHNPTKIFTSKPINTQQPVTAPCHFHPTQMITNFDRKTLMPLCPKCIPSHLTQRQSQGEVADIESIDQIHTETLQTISKQIDSITDAINKINEFKELKSDAHNTLNDALQHAKLKVQRVLDSFFAQLQKELHQVTSQDKSDIDQELLQAESFMHEKLNELHTYEQKILSPKFLKYLVRLHGSHYTYENEQYVKECHDYIEELSKKTLDIHTDDSKLYSFNLELSKYVSILNAEFYNQEQQKTNWASIHNPYGEKTTSGNNVSRTRTVPPQSNPSQDIKGQQAGFNDAGSNLKQLKPQQGEISRATIGTLPLSSPFIINTNDYFEPLTQNKCIHHFQEGTKTIFTYNVESIINPAKKPQWIQTEINQLVPNYHSSVRTQQGQIYLLGGVLNQQVLGSAYRFDFNSRNLLQINESMATPRYNHTSVVTNNKVYVFGGANKQDLNSLECLDLQLDNTLSNSQVRSQKKWTTLADMKYGGKNLSVCTFRQRYIIKASISGIEVYDINQNTWQAINSNFIPISRDCGLVQINNSSILVFGGGSQQNGYGQLKLQDTPNQLSFNFEPLSDLQNLQSRLAQPITNGTFVYQGKIYAIGVQGQTANILVGMPDQWII